jgi:hypothetical protein
MPELMCSHCLCSFLKWYDFVFFFHTIIMPLLYLTALNFILQGKKADALIKYLGEDPVRCPFEQGKQICLVCTCQFNLGQVIF